MSEDALKLTVYFGERARVAGRSAADALADIYARHGLETSLVMRGVEGFGSALSRRTDRLLTLSEDLPLVSAALDTRPRIEAALAEIDQLGLSGLVTLEPVCVVTGAGASPGETAKLTVYLGRHERAGSLPAHVAIVNLLHSRGIAGATVLLGVDGTLGGARRRARFFAANDRVPLMVLAIGDGAAIAAVLPELRGMAATPMMTLEPVRVCKRDGRGLARPDGAGGGWRKLIVYAGEQSRHGGRPLAAELVRALRAAGAPGATSLRGIRGFHGDHCPHGDRLWQLQRRVPVVTVIVDSAERILEWFEVIDRLTDETGLVTTEPVSYARINPGREQSRAEASSSR